MSYTSLVEFTNGYEDSQHIDFSRMSTETLFNFIDCCKHNALIQNSSYWLGIAEKAEREALQREIQQ
ncbi:MAG: hypothetical protein ABFD79_18750 [Phycisphaerales bacterium]